MRILGVFFAVAGLIWGIVAFNMTTTVVIASEVGETYYSSKLEKYVPRQEVHNLDLAERRRTHLMISGIQIVVGSMFYGFGSLRKSSATVPSEFTRKCPYCAEMISIEAAICKNCNSNVPPIFTIPSEYKLEQLTPLKRAEILNRLPQENLESAIRLIGNKERHEAIATLQAIIERAPIDSRAHTEAYKLLYVIFKGKNLNA